MAKKHVVSVGYTFPGNEAESVPFSSKQSLLDCDIAIFSPTLGGAWSSESFQGKLSLGESSSFTTRESVAHWRAELSGAVSTGKVVFVFLDDPIEVFVRTGEQQFSGTGRNQKVTNIVTNLSSYDAIPTNLTFRAAHGTRVRPVDGSSPIAGYWAEFASVSKYRVLIEGKLSQALLVTRSGGKAVAGVLRSGDGCLVLLPPPAYDEEAFTDWDEDEETEVWSEEACRFGKRLIAALVSLAQVIQSKSDRTVPPEWTSVDAYRLDEEARLEAKITKRT